MNRVPAPCSFKTRLMLACSSGILSSSLNTGMMTDRNVSPPNAPVVLSIPYSFPSNIFIYQDNRRGSLSVYDGFLTKTLCDTPPKFHYKNHAKCQCIYFAYSLIIILCQIVSNCLPGNRKNLI